MTKAVHSRNIGKIGNPLSPAQIEKFIAVMETMRVQAETEAETERKAPRLNFIARAKRAGFTAKQSEFLWDNRHIPEPHLIG